MSENDSAEPLQPHPFLLWYERNVRLLIPCLLLILFGSISLIGFGLASVLYSAMKKTDAYQIAWSTVEADADLKAHLGEPLRKGWSVSGKIQLQGEDGESDFSFPVIGTKGRALAAFKGRKVAGVWHFYSICFEASDVSRWKKTLVDEQPPAALTK